MDYGFPRLALAIIFFLIGFVSFGLLSSPAYEELMSKAIERNAAEWVLDPKTGKTTFTWKEIKP